MDDTETIIDGGKIITGSVAANKLDVYDATIQKIKADAIDTNSISIGQSQVTGLTGALAGKQPTGDYATNSSVTNTKNSLLSLGEQLVINGSGYLGNNTNFSS